MRPRLALAKAAVLRTVSFSFVLTLLRLRRRQCGHDPSPGGARGACAPYGHSQKQPCCALSLFHLCSLFYACGVGSVGMIPPRWSTRGVRPRSALAKTPCADGAARSFFLCLRSCKHGAGLGCLPGGARGACAPYGHSQKRLAPMALLGLFSYACARASTARDGALARWSTQGVRPRSALAKAAVLRTVSFCPRLSALYAPRYGARISPVEHAERAPPFGTRKSSRAAHCLFFICAHSSTPAA